MKDLLCSTLFCHIVKYSVNNTGKEKYCLLILIVGTWSACHLNCMQVQHSSQNLRKTQQHKLGSWNVLPDSYSRLWNVTEVPRSTDVQWLAVPVQILELLDQFLYYFMWMVLGQLLGQRPTLLTDFLVWMC